MEWLNLHSSILDSPEVIGADPKERGTWLMLLRFCIGQENSGRLRGAKPWKDRKWQQLVRVTKREVSAASDLWQWEENDLIVTHYPLEKEQEIKANRENGRKGGRPPKATQQKPPGFPPVPDRQTTRPEIAETEGKGREGERKGRGIPPKPSAPALDFVSEREQTAGQIADRIMRLRPGWARPSALTASELHALTANLPAFLSLDGTDWKLLQDYLRATVPQGGALWQPRRRSQLIDALGDVMQHADHWRAKRKGHRPAVASTSDPSLK